MWRVVIRCAIVLGCLGLPVGRAQNTTNPFQPYDPDVATVGLYHLDEGYGPAATDASGNGLDGTLYSATWTAAGRFGPGIEFAGTAFVALPNSVSFTRPDMTFEAWIKMRQFTPSPAVLIIDCYGGVLGGGRQLGITSDRKPYAFAGRQGQADAYVAIGASAVPIGQWIHLAAVFDESNGRIKIVVNGVVEDVENMATGTNLSFPINFGRHRAQDNGHFYGVLDEVRISDVARTFSTREWILLDDGSSSGAPRRVYSQGVCDPVRGRLVFFAGQDQSYARDVWGYSFGDTSWSRLHDGVELAPTSRCFSAAVYDPERDAMVIHGGGGSGPPFSDTWRFRFATNTWESMATIGEDTRSGCGCVYDPVGRRLVLYGGGGSGVWRSDVRALPLDGPGPYAWQVLNPGTAPGTPGARMELTAEYDPLSQRMFVFGGYRQPGTLKGDFWAYSLVDNTWTLLNEGGVGAPAARRRYVAAVDPVQRKYFLFGGASETEVLGDTWAWEIDTGGWTLVDDGTSGETPTVRAGAISIYQPLLTQETSAFVVFGGGTQGGLLKDLWALRTRPELEVSGVDFHLHEMYGMGLLCQPFSPVRATSFSFSYDGLATSDHSLVGFLRRGDREVLQLVSEGGTMPYFNRLVLYLLDEKVIEVHEHTPSSGTVRVDFTETEARAYIDGVLIGSGSIPPGVDLTADECCFRAAVSNHIDSHIWLNDVSLEVSGTEVLRNGDFESGCDEWRFVDISEPYQGSSPWSATNCGEQVCQATIAIVEAAVNGKSLDAASPVIRSYPGQLISGEIVIQVANHFAESSVVPVVYTPSWGDHIASYRTLAGWLSVGLHQLVVPLQLTAPTAEGTHCITFAASGDTTPEYVASLSAWSGGTPRWNDGNDLADMTPSDMSGAWTEGCALLPRYNEPGGIVLTPYGLSYVVVNVTPALAWTAEAADTARVLAEGQEFPVTVRAHGEPPDSVILRFSAGDDYQYRARKMTPSRARGDSVDYAAVIPGDEVGPRGVRFYATAHRGADVEHFRSPSYPAFVRVQADSLLFPWSTPAGVYRMISLPMRPPAGKAEILEVFGDDLGPSDATRWRAFQYDVSGRRYVEVTQASAGDLPQGRAFWLITRDPLPLDSAPVQGTSTPADRAFQIRLSPGWNMVAHPFAFSVPWDSVSALRPGGPRFDGASPELVLERPYWWDPTRQGYDDGVEVLQPFEGYWVRNRSDEELVLAIPPAPAVSADRQHGLRGEPGPTVGNAPVADEGEWSIRLVASAEGMKDGGNVAGVRRDAVDELDRWDRMKPPAPPGRSLSLAFPHPEWGPGAGDYATDTRRTPVLDGNRGPEDVSTGLGQSWFFGVTQTVPGSDLPLRVDLAFSGIPSVPEGVGVVLFDRQLSGAVDLRESGHYSFLLESGAGTSSPEDSRFVLAVGDAAYLRERASAFVTQNPQTSLSAIGPNPIRSGILLRFELAADEPASLAVYDVQGSRVRTLISGHQKAGGHEVSWNGLNERGRRAPAGVYFVQLRTPQQRITRRILLVQ